MTGESTFLRDLEDTIRSFRTGLSAGGAPVVGWCCSYVPVELLESAGLTPLRLLPTPPAEMGDAHLDPNFCPYVRAIMGEGAAGAYTFLSGLVIMNTCDGMRRLYDAWSHFQGPPFVHLMDLPRTTTRSALAYFREEICRLAERISHHFGVSISTSRMDLSFEASNRTRNLLRQVDDLMAQGRLDLSGQEFCELSRAGGLLPRQGFDTLLQNVIERSGPGQRKQGIPLLLTGSMLENPELVSIVETWGGTVVAYDLCVTGRHAQEAIPLTDDPWTSLARHYLLRPPCARMQETQRRLDLLLNLVRSYRVKGVIYYTLKFCDTFLYEAPVVKGALESMGIPMLMIESEYRKGLGGGVQTRIQAFLEMLSGGDRGPRGEGDL